MLCSQGGRNSVKCTNQEPTCLLCQVAEHYNDLFEIRKYMAQPSLKVNLSRTRRPICRPGAVCPGLQGEKHSPIWCLVVPVRWALLEWAEVWSGVVWEGGKEGGRRGTVQVLWTEAYLKTWEETGAGWDEEGADPLTRCNTQKSRPWPHQGSTIEPTLLAEGGWASPKVVSMGDLSPPLTCLVVVQAGERCPPLSPSWKPSNTWGRWESWPCGHKNRRAVSDPYQLQHSKE